jgi:hypothetical protein
LHNPSIPSTFKVRLTCNGVKGWLIKVLVKNVQKGLFIEVCEGRKLVELGETTTGQGNGGVPMNRANMFLFPSCSTLSQLESHTMPIAQLSHSL